MSQNLYYCDTATDPDNWECKQITHRSVPSSLEEPNTTHIVLISVLSVIGSILLILLIYFLLLWRK